MEIVDAGDGRDAAVSGDNRRRDGPPRGGGENRRGPSLTANGDRLMGPHGTDRKAHSMRSGRHAHDLQAVPLPGAQGGIGHMGTQRVLWAAAPAGTDEKICGISFTKM